MAFTEATPLRARRPSRKAVSNTVILAAFLAACALVAHLTSRSNERSVLLDADEDDTTGRILSHNAIMSAGIEEGGKMSSAEQAVLADAASIKFHRKVSQDEIEAARVEREVSAGVRRAKQQTMAARKEFDNLNKGYAQQMQRYLTGNSAVGDVNKVIDSHSATYLSNTGEFGAQRRTSTLIKILKTAEHQRAKEKRGLVAVNPDAPVHAEEEEAAPRAGVRWTPDGYVLLRSADADAAKKAPTQLLDSIDGCACFGSSDEDKGPRCHCAGQPNITNPAEEWSDSEVTKWAHDQRARTTDTKLTQGTVTAQPEDDPDTAAAKAWAMAHPPVAWGKPQQQPSEGASANKGDSEGANKGGDSKEADKQPKDDKAGSKPAVEDKDGKASMRAYNEADEMNEALQTVLERAAETVKSPAQKQSFSRLASTVRSLQDVVVRDPQSRDLAREKLVTLVGGQSLLDYANVFVMPSVDDLDNYLQGVLNTVDKTEIPDADAIIGAKDSGKQTLSQVATVLPATSSIDAYLSSLLAASFKLHSPKSDDAAGVAKMNALKATVQEVASIADKKPQSRDLIARRLAQLKTKTMTQSLLDYPNVYVMPSVDDLDNYLQGVLDEVQKTEIPDADAIINAEADKAVSARTSTLRQVVKQHARGARTSALLPLDVYGEDDVANKFKQRDHGEYVDKMQWQKQPWTENEEDAKVTNKVTEDVWGDLKNKMVHGDKTLTKGAVNNAYGWQGAEGGAAEIPVTHADGLDTKRAAGPHTQHSLNKGSRLCDFVNCDGNVSPFPPAARRTRHASLAEQHTEEHEEAQPAGGESAGAEAEQEAHEEAQDAAVEHEEAPSVPESEQEEEEEEADKGRADLGDEVFGIGAFANENEDDVLMKADDPNVSLPYYMARGRKGAFPRKQLLKATSSLKPQQLSASASPRARAHPSEYGVPLPLA